MDELQEIIQKVKTLIQEGKSVEEVFQFLSPFLNQGSESIERLAEHLANLPYGVTVSILQRMLEGAE